MAKKNFVERLSGVLEDVADIAALGARVARESQKLLSKEAADDMSEELGERATRISGSRQKTKAIDHNGSN